jgi:three-Cys-motif partner protein
VRRFGGTWSESQLDCVQQYITQYLKVMQNQEWCTVQYIDAFAGRGKQLLRAGSGTSEAREAESLFGDMAERRDTGEFLLGSAVRALAASRKATRPFDGFVFVDSDKPSCDELDALISESCPELRSAVTIHCEDANVALERHVADTDWSSVRAVVFLDPFGTAVNWSTVKRLADTRACDVWYLFPLIGVIRMMTNNGRIPEAWRMRLNRVFGTSDWFAEFYRSSGQKSLFDDTLGTQFKDASTEDVVGYVRRRLEDVFPAVSNAGILRNSKGAPLFALVLGVSSKSPRAQTIASGIANHLVKGLGS